MKRGDIWTVSGGKDYMGKPRPIVIVQDDSFDGTDSITVCAFTTDETDAPLFRLSVEPNERNGLRATCRLMVVLASAGWTTKISYASIGPCSSSSDWPFRPEHKHNRWISGVYATDSRIVAAPSTSSPSVSYMATS
jgi:hypothetical protein